MPFDWDPDAPDYQGLVFAPGSNMFTVSPSWTRIDSGALFGDGVRVGLDPHRLQHQTGQRGGVLLAVE